MMEFTEIHIKILLVLSDMDGYSNKQLTKLLGMQKTNLSRALGELEEHGVILRGEPRKSMEGKRYIEMPYYINVTHPEESRKDLRFFEFIIKKTVEINNGSICPKLLKSKYVNKLIEKYRFVSLFDILKKYNDNDVFNSIVSQSILHQPAFIIEIERYHETIKNDSEYADAMVVLGSDKNNLIGLLNYFNPLDAIPLYRDTIGNKYGNLFREIHEHYFSESFKNFVYLDIFLSPFTSYPVDDPIRILFEKPFERLYDNAYLIEALDYELFIQRAYVVYSNFAEILYQGMRHLTSQEIDLLDYRIRELEKLKDTTELDYWDEENDVEMVYLDKKMNSLHHIEKSLDIVLKASIFYWNIASNRIDSIYQKLIFEKKYNKTASGKYRILTDDKGLKVIDLWTNKSILDSSDSMKIMGTYFLLDVLLDNCRDPFTFLRPCDVFKETGLNVERIIYEELFEKLNSQVYPR